RRDPGRSCRVQADRLRCLVDVVDDRYDHHLRRLGAGPGPTVAACRLPGRALHVRRHRRRLPGPHPVATAGPRRWAGPGRHPRPRLAPTVMTPCVAWELVRSGHLVRSLRRTPLVTGIAATAAFLAARGGDTHDAVGDLRVLGLLLVLGSGYVLDDSAAVTLQ